MLIFGILVCVGDFSQTNGVLMPPQNVSFYYCEWERSKPSHESGTLVLSIATRYMSHTDKRINFCRHSSTVLDISYGI